MNTKKPIKKSKQKNQKKVKVSAKTLTQNNRCIICGKEKNGINVQNDYIIDLIRWIKKNITKNEKNYKLVVCQDCYMKYKKMYNSFKRKKTFYIILGVIFMLLLFFASHFNVYSLISGFALIIFLYLLSLLTYMPRLKIQDNKNKEENKSE